VNDDGKVIGVASMKLSGGGAIDSVGLASPIKSLSKLLVDSGIKLTGVPSSNAGKKTAPEIVSEITPSVVLINARGRTNGIVRKVNFQASYGEHPSGIGPLLSRQSNGAINVTSLGQIQSIQSREGLPYALGPIGGLFFEPLDPIFQNEWTVTQKITLQSTPNTQSLNFPFGPRFGRFGFPFEQPKNQATESVPAIEQISYKLIKEEAGKLLFARNYKFHTLDSESDPSLKQEGEGTWQFDIENGVSHALVQKLKYTARGSQASDLVISYERISEQSVAEEREKQKIITSVANEKAKQERDVPNPEMVTSLMDELRSAALSSKAWVPMQKLAAIAVVEEHRASVLELIREHLKSSGRTRHPQALAAFCHWSNSDCQSELVEMLQQRKGDPDSRHLLEALGRIHNPENLPLFVKHLFQTWGKDQAQKAIESYGSQAEELLIQGMDDARDHWEQRTIIQILGSHCGTFKSIEMLRGLSGNVFIKSDAQRAIQKIQAREGAK
jgi:hypothetical protein